MIQKLFNFLLDFISVIQINVTQLEKTPFGYSIINFSITFFVSLLAYFVFYPQFAYKTDLVRTIKKTLLSSMLGWFSFFLYSLVYATLTGVGSSALLYVQSKQMNFSSAVIYGFIGPHFLKKQMQMLMMSSTTNGVIKKIDVIQENIDQDKDYYAVLSTIEEDLNSMEVEPL